LLDPDELTERIGVTEEIQGGGLPDDRDLGGAVDVLGPERSTGGERPVVSFQILLGHAVDVRGPVEVAEDDLRFALRVGRCDLHGPNLARDGSRVVFGEGELGALAKPDTTRGHAAGLGDEEVGAEALDPTSSSPSPAATSSGVR